MAAELVNRLAATKERRLKVLMVAPTSFFNDYGGHIRILEETRALQARGHKVTIVTYYKGKDVAGIQIQRTKALPWHSDYEVGSSRHKLAFDVYLMAETLRVAYRLRPDVIHGHMHEGALIGGLVSRMLNLPLVFDFQGSLTSEMVDHGFLNPSGRFYSWVYRLEKIIDRLPNAILTSSIQARKLLENDFNIAVEKIFPLPDCVDTAAFDPSLFSEDEKAELKRSIGLPLNKTIVVYLGLLTDYQGIPSLLSSAAELKRQRFDIHFLIMGYPNMDHYSNIAEQMGILDMVTFTGRVDYGDAPRFLSLGQLAVSPKISATEGSGKVLNYMAMGLPIIATNTEVHREYLGKLGNYVPPGDVSELVNAIKNQAALLGKADNQGQKLRQRAIDSYSWGMAGREISQIYIKLMSRARHKR